MAQEAILNVSLKDYKKNIDELRGSLLGLEKDSEDYKKIAEELKDKQDKLNEVMSVGKESVNAVDGSYNQLSATLSRLKKEWKNMEIGTPEWEAMAVRINDINNQLKDADAQVGVFTRNVGDYANAFEEAFKVSAQGLSSMPGMIGSIANTTKQLIPLIQKANATATTGLNGVKKALVSTGIGALIVAVGVLITNFDKIRDFFKGKDNPAKLAQDSFDSLKKSIDSLNESLELETQLMEASGASTEEVRLKKIELIKAQQAETLAQLENVRATIKQIEAHSKFRQWITGEKKDLESLRETEQELFNLEASQSKEITKLLNSNTADRIKEKKKAADEEKKLLKDTLKAIDDASKSEIEKLTEKYNKEKTLLKKYHKDTTELTKQYNKNIEAINDKALDDIYSKLAEFSPFEKISREYDKAYNTLLDFQEVVNEAFPPEALIDTEEVTEEMIKKAHDYGLIAGDTPEEFVKAWQVAYLNFKKMGKEMAAETTTFTQEFQDAMQVLKDDGRMSEYYNASADAAFARLNKHIENLDVVRQKLEDIKEGVYNLEDEDFESFKEAGDYYRGFYQEMQNLLTEYSRDWEHASAEAINYTNSLKQVQMEMGLLEKEFGYTKPKGYHEAIKNLEDYYKQYIAAYEEVVERAKTIEFESEEARATVLDELNRKKLEKIEWFEQERERIEEEYQGKSNAWQWFSNTSRFYEIYDARLKAAEWYRDNLEIIEGETNEEREKRELEAEQAILQIKREYAKKHIEISQSLGNGLTSIWGSINDIYEANAKAQGKTDEEVFEKTKGSRIAVATIDTIQGSLAAFMGWQEYPQPYAAIMGGIQAAATLAAGMAQIAQIRATQFNSAGQNISNPQAVVNATPRMVDYAPDLVSNVTGASEIDSLKNALQETPIFVSVSDINEAQVKVTDRNKESSF